MNHENDSREGAKPRKDIEQIASIVIDCAMHLHKDLGRPINFGAPLLKDGLKRVVNNHSNFASSRLRVHNQIELQ